jgi:hypothetical protein
MNPLFLWCKRCFGLKTVSQRMKEELAYAELEEYSILARLMSDQSRLRLIKRRITFLKGKLK